MTPTRRAVLAAAGTLTTALAGCTGSPDEGDGGEETTGRQTTTAGTAGAGTSGGGTRRATVRTRSHPDLGTVLVDAEGTTLYLFEQDSRGAGRSACTGDCADDWPPLTVEGAPAVGEGVTGEVTTFERASGGRQVAVGGWPLYRFAADETAGDANGQGVGDVWWVVRPDGTPAKSPATEGGGDF